MNAPLAHWEILIPATRGALPDGTPIARTDPGGSFDARIVMLGVYPAAHVANRNVHQQLMKLPIKVERTSFEKDVSASAIDLDRLYLERLNIDRDDVLLLDLMPYFLSNTRKSNGNSMADNIEKYEKLTGQQLGIGARPSPAKLVRQASSMPGNIQRLADYMQRSCATLMLTLGSEAAAFARGETYHAVNNHARDLFYKEPVEMNVAGVMMAVVHLAHPGLLMSPQGRSSGWYALHDTWCATLGMTAVAATRQRGE